MVVFHCKLYWKYYGFAHISVVLVVPFDLLFP